ncbi:unnamed protein product [Pedinophyceae sp. YPF-701]|nr:unnamed protein product [Pedinophyceae sp. YPF-701]
MQRKIKEIQSDAALDDREKARRIQELHGWHAGADSDSDGEDDEETRQAKEMLGCPVCFEFCERPVTARCGHSCCLACFKQLLRHKTGQLKCPKCKNVISDDLAHNPRINVALIAAIKEFKRNRNRPLTACGPRPSLSGRDRRISMLDRPDQAFRSERAVRSGLANAASGKMLVSAEKNHLGPIGPEYDISDEAVKRGCYVGREFTDRMNCRQWGAHLPHVSGIAGGATGAPSVVASAGYDDDVDMGEWMLYTGSGGRDLTGNKRTNNYQEFDQEWVRGNEALRGSCKLGLPVRVVRSCKMRHSNYAPDPTRAAKKVASLPGGKGTRLVDNDLLCRYDGVYRVIKCWRRPTSATWGKRVANKDTGAEELVLEPKGVKPPLMCRYLLVRCDNEGAPWTTQEGPNLPLAQWPKAARAEMDRIMAKELAEACDVESLDPKEEHWGFEDGKWGWVRTPPAAPVKKARKTGAPRPRGPVSMARRHISDPSLACGLCDDVLQEPVQADCGHNFCKSCMEGHWPNFQSTKAAKTDTYKMRSRKNVATCPVRGCEKDITATITRPVINRDLEQVIDKIRAKIDEQAARRQQAAAQNVLDAEGGDGGRQDSDKENAALRGGDGGASAPSSPKAARSPSRGRSVPLSPTTQAAAAGAAAGSVPRAASTPRQATPATRTTPARAAAPTPKFPKPVASPASEAPAASRGAKRALDTASPAAVSPPGKRQRR